MKSLIIGVAAFAALCSSAMAEERYDRKLEQAMRDIVAAKIGDLRGSFDFNRQPEFVVVQDTMSTGSIRPRIVVREPRQSRDEMIKVAVERKVARVILF